MNSTSSIDLRQSKSPQPSPEILSDVSHHLKRVHKLLLQNMPRSEFPSIRQRRLWRALDAIRAVVESIDLEARS